jgi:ketosteroid isomerase-like protein
VEVGLVTLLEVRKEIDEIERLLREAMLTPDVSTLDRITASDFVWTHSSGAVDAKLAWLERLRSAKTRYTRLDTSDVEVRSYGDAVLVSGRLDMTFVAEPSAKELPIRFLRVWIRQDGDWRLAAHASTLIRT